MCKACVTTFDSKRSFEEHEARHWDSRREATEEEKWALAVMLQEENILAPCPPHLEGAYKIGSTRTAKEIEQEDSRVVANFVQHLVKAQAKHKDTGHKHLGVKDNKGTKSKCEAKAEDRGGNRHKEEIWAKDKHKQKGETHESSRHGDGTGGKGAGHQDVEGRWKKKGGDLMAVFNRAMAARTGN